MNKIVIAAAFAVATILALIIAGYRQTPNQTPKTTTYTYTFNGTITPGKDKIIHVPVTAIDGVPVHDRYAPPEHVESTIMITAGNGPIIVGTSQIPDER